MQIHITKIRNKKVSRLTFVLVTLVSSVMTACSDSTNKVSFSHDVFPILQSRCHECHLPGGQGFNTSGLSMVDYESLMKGTKFGPVIKPGDSLSSTLVVLVEGRADKSINMPHGDREPLTPNQISIIKSWIDQGAKKN